MGKQRVTKRQAEVLDDLFGGEMSEVEVLAKHKVAMGTYRRWLECEVFVDEYDFRIESSRRQGQLIIARYVPAAAAKLVGLAGDDKGEVARKACLDVMSLPFCDNNKKVLQVDDNSGMQIDADLASRLLKSLAEEKG